MPATNSSQSYGTVTRTFHWLIALLIIPMIPLGIYANGLAHQIETGDSTPTMIEQAQLLFSLHKTIGVFIFFAALARILWAISQPKPKPLHPDRRAETFLASLVHWLLYASLVLVPLSGWVHHAATTGFAPIWWPFGQTLPFVPQTPATAESFASLHIIFERVLVISILLHVAGALKHHFIDRDATLRRMWSGLPAAGQDHAHNTLLAPAAALGIYAIALGIGASLGLFSHTATAVEPELAEVASDWTVTEGRIGFTITQLGSEVDGSFTDWTSAITFDPSVPAGDTPAGQVETTIAITSVAVGSVTSQATGAAFFDIATHPTATYSGDIYRTDTGYEARGTLTLKGIEQPLTFPFDLSVEDKTATMAATFTLNRLDHEIGTSEPTESNLAFDVTVNIALTATTGE